jgi:hypothetical protein
MDVSDYVARERRQIFFRMGREVGRRSGWPCFFSSLETRSVVAWIFGRCAVRFLSSSVPLLAGLTLDAL